MSILLQETLLRYAADLANAARLFTLPQLASHPTLSGFAQPKIRACRLLRPYDRYFEKFPAPIGQTQIWRLSKVGRTALSVNVRNVSATSQKARHYVAIGDTWARLTFAGLRPSHWILEPRDSAEFDAFFVIDKRYPFLVEVQRSRLSARQWNEKWKRRFDWLDDQNELAKAPWQPKGMVVRPTVMVVDMTGGDVKHPEGVVSVTLENIASRVRWMMNKRA